MSKIHENTLTDILSQVLREKGINALSQLGASIGNYTPDLVIKDDSKLFLCEAEWESSKFEGLIQVANYSLLPEASGSILILYPNEIKKNWQDAHSVELEKYKYKAFFFSRERKTVPSKPLTISELVSWIKDQIVGKESVDIDGFIDTLQELVVLLKDEMPVIEENMSVFKNVLGIEVEISLKHSIAQYASAYLLINQLLFYQILSNYKPTMYPPVNENQLTNPYELKRYFDRVLKEDYQAIYSIDVARTLTVNSLSKIATVVRVLRALALDKYRPEIIGKVFHTLIPIEIRKIVAAYFTKEYAADILATYAIGNYDDKVIDLACGSGTLLVAAYHRKISLIENVKTSERIHKKFVEEDITGLDIMPFSAHLSTINLALQQPLAETNFIRVGIFDSTNAKPETEILPLREVVPLSQRQRNLTDFVSNSKKHPKLVQQGAISLIPDQQHSFLLKKVNAVLMNPPFTRQESISKIGLDYKKSLVRKFTSKSVDIEGKSSFYSFFILIADKFLKDSGRLALVLPATILSKETDQSIRSFILRNYRIDAIITRSEGFNFSENTTLSEILLLSKKEKPAATSLTTYIVLKNLDSISKDHVKYILENRTANEEVDNQNYHAITFLQKELNLENLFIPISLSDCSLMATWKNLTKSKIMATTKDLGLSLEEGLRSRQGGKYPESGLSAIDTNDLTKRDSWVIYNYDKDNILIRHRFKADISFCIPKRHTYLGMRNTLGRTSFDVSNVQDRILIEKFAEFEDFAAFGDLVDDNFSSNWKKWVLNRGVNLAVIETLHPEARNTYFFAYFSEPLRAFSSKFWNVKTNSIDEAKIMVLWFNSSLNFIQLLINRIPTGWFKIRGYVFEQLKAPSLERMSTSFRKKAILIFEKFKNEPFPALWSQLARNVEKGKTQSQDWKLMKSTFEDFEIEVGIGFEPRKEIDLLFLEMLNPDVKNKPEFLSDLYMKLLKEICLIKKSAVEV